MDIKLRLVIHSKKSIYDDLIAEFSGVSQRVKTHQNHNPSDEIICEKTKRMTVYVPSFLNNRRINSYAVSAYVDTLKRSDFYRRCALTSLVRRIKLRSIDDEYPVILIRLKMPEKQFLDYKWGERITEMALERCEVDLAMSWLSTLGGAFSALGEHFHHCAQMAGKISSHQFVLALRLGDPLLVARCKLYAALSIIQRGNLRIPRRMIEDIFKFAVQEKDAHLQRMCQGVWAKLSYCYKLKRQRKKQLKKGLDPESENIIC